MKFAAVVSALSFLVSIALFAPGCGDDEHHCETDADCEAGESCHTEEGADPHCMEAMGDDDDSSGD